MAKTGATKKTSSVASRAGSKQDAATGKPAGSQRSLIDKALVVLFFVLCLVFLVAAVMQYWR